MMNRIVSMQGLIAEAERGNTTISQTVLEWEALKSKETTQEVFARMERNLLVMEQSIQDGMDATLRSQSGLSGGLAGTLRDYVAQNGSLGGDLLADAMSYALAIAERNACMGRIVAAPTAGACGILPGALLAAAKHREIPHEKVVMALFNAAGVGQVIEWRASLSGAEGGCQAECGSASAMAASALVEILGGTPIQCGHAAALAIKFVMGLVCDPVAGLVEVPCVKRNASGAGNALIAAQLAIAGIPSVIPPDEVFDAMKSVGMMMNCSLKETSKGGIAASPCAKCISKELKAKAKEGAMIEE